MRIKLFRSRTSLIASLALLLTGNLVFADFLTLQPGAAAGKDTQLVSGLPNSNLGTYQYIMDNWGDNSRSISLVEFDISGLPSGSTILSATLTLFHQFNSNLNQRYDVFRVTSAWNEMTATYNNAPTIDGTAVSTLTIPDSSTGVFRSWNLTSLVQGWSNNSYANFGMWIEEIPVQGLASAYFTSSDHGTEAWRPKLQIEYINDVPVPSGIILAGMGLVGMALLRKRFRTSQVVC